MRPVRRVALVAFAMVMTLIPAVPGGAAPGDPSELFISEYVEGSSNNKALEIFNGTGAPVDLGAGSYSIQMYFNGNSTASLTINLVGTLSDGDVFVVAHSSADPAILDQADQTNGAGWFNGNDAVVLRQGSTVVDAFGQVGNDVTYAANTTLRRMADICAGDSITDDVFDASDEWDVLPEDTFNGLGSHTASCGSTGGTPEVIITEIMYNPASAEDDWEWVEVANIGDATANLAGWVIDDSNSVAHSSANIVSGSVPAATSAVLFNADDVSASDFAAAWGAGMNLIAVTDWSAMALNNGGDTIGLWTDFASYDGDNVSQANAVESISYDDSGSWPSDDNSGSIYLIDLAADRTAGASWDLSFDGAITPVNDAYQSVALGGNSGSDIASPSSLPPTVIIDPLGICGDPATFIHEIQGSGLASDDVGNIREIEGVVVGDFQDDVGANGDLNGFYVQEEDADADADPATSEGIFVFQGSNPTVDVANGDVVRVRGAVTEFNGLTEITDVESLAICGSGSASPSILSLPVDDIDDFEAYEGMAVTFPDALTISEFFNFDRFGEIVLTTERLYQPTAVYEPGSPEAAAAADLIVRSRITLDDGRTSQNPDPAIHPNGDEFTLDNLFRGGDTVTNVTGVMDYGFGLYRIQPTQGADYTAVNDRPAAPEAVGGSLTVASFNVLNYFNTLDDGGEICGPLENQECRGADNAEERDRQLDKIVSAMDVMDSDVLGIIEVENTAGVEAMADIVDGLNDLAGSTEYAYIDTGTIGSDAIKVGFIYKPGTVTPVGDFAVLDSAEFVAPFGIDRNRPALAQTFVENATGGKFTAVVNHLKSKGSSCGAGDDDPEAGSCNLTRTVSAQVLADWLATDPTGSGDSDFLIIGDLNSYDKEDPIDVLKAAGYTDLLFEYQGELAYSYVFDGQLGYLDYAMANGSLSSQVTGATAWHINADEPDLIDYDTSFKQDAQDEIYAPDPYRSSDHDPVIVGLDLNASPSCEAAEPSVGDVWPPRHQMVDIEIVGCTDADGDAITIAIDSIFQDESVNGDDDGNTAPDGAGIGTSTAQVRAERDGDGNGRVYHIGFTATDSAGGTTSGEVVVTVAVNRSHAAVDDGPLFDSTIVP